MTSFGENMPQNTLKVDGLTEIAGLDIDGLDIDGRLWAIDYNILTQ